MLSLWAQRRPRELGVQDRTVDGDPEGSSGFLQGRREFQAGYEVREGSGRQGQDREEAGKRAGLTGSLAPRWTLDSGANRVLRNAEHTDVPADLAPIQVGAAGDQSFTAGQDVHGELVTHGEQLLPLGRAVRTGGWSFAWTPNGGPRVAQLGEQDQRKVDEIVANAPEAFRPVVSDDIPYVCDKEAVVIRDSMKSVSARRVVCHEDVTPIILDTELSTDENCEVLARRLQAADPVLSEDARHALTHFPVKPGCEVCDVAKRQRQGFVRKSASDQKVQGAPPGPFLTLDFAMPSTVASNGDRVLAVVGWVQTGASFAVPLPKKKGMVTHALHQARVEWDIDSGPWTLHSDNEPVLKDPAVQKYLQDTHGVEWTGVPHVSNTNARAERFVRSAEDGIRSLLVGSNLPCRMWHLAADAWNVLNSRGRGIPSRRNTAPSVPFGTIGKAVLPRGLLARDKFQSRVVTVAHLGYDRLTSGGVRVLFVGADQKLHKGVCLNRDIAWEPGRMAFSRSTRNLRDALTILPEFQCINPVSDYLAACDTCGKWRYCSQAIHEVAQRSAFHCPQAGVSCQNDEDPRVWDELHIPPIPVDGEPSFAPGADFVDLVDDDADDEDEAAALDEPLDPPEDVPAADIPAQVLAPPPAVPPPSS